MGVACAAGDFSAETAAKRLALLRTLTDLPDVEMSEREVLLYLEHLAPREQEHARRAIAGLLSYHQRAGEETGERLVVSALRRFSLESQLFMAPECFLSLGIFADDLHPSAHGHARAPRARARHAPATRAPHARRTHASRAPRARPCSLAWLSARRDARGSRVSAAARARTASAFGRS